MFGDRGVIVGNPGLEPESAGNVDLGFALSWGDPAWRLSGSVEGAFFGSFAEDLVVFLPQSQSVFRAENVGSSRTLGCELTLRADWADHVSASVRYAFQDARDTGDVPYWSGGRVPGRPPHDLAFRLEGSYGPLRAWYELDWLSETALDRANLRWVPMRATHAAGFGLSWSRPGLEVRVAVEGRNLGDAWVYDAFRYPLPGRSFFGSVSVRM
jgi:outer membrane receptor protein involved in Fe transport